MLEFPVDGKKAHGRACYCNNCKRLRCRAMSLGRGYDVAWLRSALQAGELRERLGEHAAAVLTVHQADKPVTFEMSPDALIEWAPEPTPRRSSAPAGRASGGGGGTAAGTGAAPDQGGAGHARASTSTAVDELVLARRAVAFDDGGEDDKDDSTAALMTRRILLEHREFARLYLQVREHVLEPGITAEQLAADEQTAAELEVHMQQLREMIGLAVGAGEAPQLGLQGN